MRDIRNSIFKKSINKATQKRELSMEQSYPFPMQFANLLGSLHRKVSYGLLTQPFFLAKSCKTQAEREVDQTEEKGRCCKVVYNPEN